MSATKTRFEVTAEDAGLRLDQIIPRHVGGLSRRKARAVIDLGGVFVDRARVKVAGRQLRVNLSRNGLPVATLPMHGWFEVGECMALVKTQLSEANPL